MKSSFKVFLTVALLVQLYAAGLAFLLHGHTLRPAEFLWPILAEWLPLTFILAVAMAGLAFLVQRIPKITGCVLLPVMCLCGMVISFSITRITEALPHGEWEQVSTFPERPARFSPDGYSGYSWNVHVFADSGSLYAADCWDPQSCDWRLVDPAAVDLSHENSVFCSSKHRTPKPPGKEIDSAQKTICGADGHIQVNYIITEDGSLWMWRRGYMAVAQYMAYVITTPLGLLVGFFSGVVLWFRLPPGKKFIHI